MASKEEVIAARKRVESYSGRKLRIMEVCGTHTHEIFGLGIRSILPRDIELISGPGCPVCVTPVGYIDEAVMLALDKGATVCTFGDLVRVPGTEMSLAEARSKDAKVRLVYSPADALDYAKEHPDEEVVFLSVGFETTTPGSCIAVRNAKNEGIKNFSILTANKTMFNAYIALKDSADAFMYPGHVSTVTGMQCYYELEKLCIYGAVTGFTAPEIIIALDAMIKGILSGKPFALNCYKRVVREDGSPAARRIIEEMMEPYDAEWRGLGIIEKSGLRLNAEHADFDARKKFDLPEIKGRSNPACRCGDVLLGECTPLQCPVFGKVCTPEHPVGACMVSGEGACSAYYKYGGESWRNS